MIGKLGIDHAVEQVTGIQEESPLNTLIGKTYKEIPFLFLREKVQN